MRFHRLGIWAILASLSITAAPAQPASSPESVVRSYTDAANRGDLEAFLSLYDPEIRKYRFPGQLTSQGIEHNREAYARSFAANPSLRVEIVELMTLGDKVMVHDRVTGLASGQTSDELTVYQVRNGAHHRHRLRRATCKPSYALSRMRKLGRERTGSFHINGPRSPRSMVARI